MHWGLWGGEDLNGNQEVYRDVKLVSLWECLHKSMRSGVSGGGGGGGVNITAVLSTRSQGYYPP